MVTMVTGMTVSLSSGTDGAKLPRAGLEEIFFFFLIIDELRMNKCLKKRTPITMACISLLE